MKRRDFLKFLAAAPALLTLPAAKRIHHIEPIDSPLEAQFGRGTADIMEPKQRELTALYKAYLEDVYKRKFSNRDIAHDLYAMSPMDTPFDLSQR